MKKKNRSKVFYYSKVCGLPIKFSTDEIIIYDSYKIKNIDKMELILNRVLEKNEYFKTKRKIKSFIKQWITYNKLYRLFLFRKHTRNITFRTEQSIIKSFLCSLLSLHKRLKFKRHKKRIAKKIKRNRKKYTKYILKHKENIMKAYKEMEENSFIFQLGDKALLLDLYDRALVHDDSKFSEEEFEPYRKNFFPINKHEQEENVKVFDKAWKHHWKNNPHHWQYRQNKKTFDRNNEEDVLNVLENVMDWLAMGYEFGDRPYQYYGKIKDTLKLKLNEDERKFLEDVIYKGVDESYLAIEKNYVTKEELDERINKKHGRRKRKK